MLNPPALYRTTISHRRRTPVLNSFTHRSYTWFVDIDDLPRLPLWLRPFAVFRAEDHLSPTTGAPDSLRARVEEFLAAQGVTLDGGPVYAMMHARVLGYVFNPISVFWCYRSDGTLAHVVVEVHNTYGGRHAYLLPPTDSGPVVVPKQFYVSPFNEVDGYYLVHAPQPGETAELAVSWHRDGELVFAATLQGKRRRVSNLGLARLQLSTPLAPLAAAIQIRLHGISLWRRGLTVVPRTDTAPSRKAS